MPPETAKTVPETAAITHRRRHFREQYRLQPASKTKSTGRTANGSSCLRYPVSRQPAACDDLHRCSGSGRAPTLTLFSLSRGTIFPELDLPFEGKTIRPNARKEGTASESTGTFNKKSNLSASFCTTRRSFGYASEKRAGSRFLGKSGMVSKNIARSMNRCTVR